MKMASSVFNINHSLLRKVLSNPIHPEPAREVFLSHHAMVHASAISGASKPTFADETLSGLNEPAWRTIPLKSEHSIAWIVWHMSRIEDVSMNMLLANRAQVFTEGGWQKKLNVAVADTGNLLPPEKTIRLGMEIDLNALMEYRLQVGKRTRENFLALDPHEWKCKVELKRVARLIPEGAVAPYANGVPEYWSGLTYAGLLLMPATRHNFIHLNEILKMKRKFGS